jgi:hypothetical protein
MRVLLREEILSVAGSDGGGASGVTFDAGVSPAPAPSPAVSPSCPPGYSPSITGSQTTNGTGWSATIGVNGVIPTGSLNINSPANSTTITSGCLPTLAGTGAPEAGGNPYNTGPNVGDPNGPTP